METQNVSRTSKTYMTLNKPRENFKDIEDFQLSVEHTTLRSQDTFKVMDFKGKIEFNQYLDFKALKSYNNFI